MSFDRRDITLISLFAVVYNIFRLLPSFPSVLGLPAFTSADAIAPLYGIAFGPLVGGSAVILGTFLSFLFGRPPLFLYLDFLPALVNAVSVGLIVRKKRLPVIALFSGLLTIYLLHPLSLRIVQVPVGESTVFLPFNWTHFLALLLLVSPLAAKASDWVRRPTMTRLAQGIAVLAFIGTLMQHLMGGILTETVPGLLFTRASEKGWALFWTLVFWVYPIERAILAIVATVVGAPVVRVLKVSGSIERFLVASKTA